MSSFPSVGMRRANYTMSQARFDPQHHHLADALLIPPDLMKTEKDKDLLQNTTEDREPMTTNHAVPISTDQNSLKAGPRGPTLLEDFVLRDRRAEDLVGDAERRGGNRCQAREGIRAGPRQRERFRRGRRVGPGVRLFLQPSRLYRIDTGLASGDRSSGPAHEKLLVSGIDRRTSSCRDPDPALPEKNVFNRLRCLKMSACRGRKSLRGATRNARTLHHGFGAESWIWSPFTRPLT
jgi:hypothetical protein